MKTSTLLLGAGGALAAYLLYKSLTASSSPAATSAPAGADAASTSNTTGLFTDVINQGLSALGQPPIGTIVDPKPSGGLLGDVKSAVSGLLGRPSAVVPVSYRRSIAPRAAIGSKTLPPIRRRLDPAFA